MPTNAPDLEKIVACRICGSDRLSPCLDLGLQPFANSLLPSIDAMDAKYELALTFCEHCGMVQLTATADPSKLFSHYLWVTGTSSTSRQQADVFCTDALALFGDQAEPRWVCEVASNDGTYLRPFRTRGLQILGVDAAANVVELAITSEIPTQCAFFDKTVAQDLRRERGPADIVIARNVLAHVPDPLGFVGAISELVAEDGIAVIEFHYGRKVLEGLQYDSIYHEHLFYITALGVETLLQRNGLEVIEFAESPTSGGALIVYAQRAGGRRKVRDSVARYRAAERSAGINDLETWKKFGRDVYLHKKQFIACLDSELAAGHRVVGYGASARSSTMLNFCGIKRRQLPEIADKSRVKWGLYTAGSHIPIRSPEEVLGRRPDAILLLAWNFQDEVLADLEKRYGFKGRVILPLPNTPLVVTINSMEAKSALS
jgi:SAM-dependent methyltransferase